MVGRRLFKFSIAGLVNTAIGYIVIFFCMQLGLSPSSANLIGYAVGLVMSFLQSRYWVFESKGSLGEEWPKFIMVFLLAYAANFLLLRLLLAIPVNAYVAQLFACAAYIAVSFVLNSRFVFLNVERSQAVHTQHVDAGDRISGKIPDRGAMTQEFDKFAANYETQLDKSLEVAGESAAYFAAYKADYIARMLDSRPSQKILDFGCGIGILSSAVAERRPEDIVHGFDVSVESLRQVSRDLLKRGIFTSKLQELDRNYDLIVISNVLHHIPRARRQEIVSDISARLTDTGRVLVIEHNPLNPMTRWVVSHCQFDEDAVLLRPREVKQYCNRAGLCKVRNEYIVFFPKALSGLRRLERNLAWLPAGAQYALTASK